MTASARPADLAEPEGEAHPFYTDVPLALNHEVAIGGALITMVEPHLGHEHAYNRWYEDDHFYAGAMCMPWMFAGRRFVATRELQLLRYPHDSFIAQPVTAGCYIHLYWITTKHYADHVAWTRATNMQLTALDRRFEERTHVFTTFPLFAGATYRDAEGPRDIHSLDYPYAGIVLEVFDAPEGATRDALDAWLEQTYLPGLQQHQGCPVAQSLRFVSSPPPAGTNTGPSASDGTPPPSITSPQRGFAIPGAERRVTVIHFLDEDPRVGWTRHFAGNGDKVAASGLGRLELCAPFVPTLMGTDRYVDELR